MKNECCIFARSVSAGGNKIPAFAVGGMVKVLESRKVRPCEGHVVRSRVAFLPVCGELVHGFDQAAIGCCE